MAKAVSAQQGENSRQLSNGSNSTPSRSSGSETLPAVSKGIQFLPALQRLCSSKNTVQMTKHGAETWTAALSLYADKPRIVNLAVVELAVSPDPFPDLGKLLAVCERIRRTLEGTLPQDSTKITFKDHEKLARAWGLDT